MGALCPNRGLWYRSLWHIRKFKSEEYYLLKQHMKEARILKGEVPIWEKSNLTLEEAAEYSGIGINKLRKLSDRESCPFVLWVGSKRLIKRRKLDEYVERMYSI